MSEQSASGAKLQIVKDMVIDVTQANGTVITGYVSTAVNYGTEATPDWYIELYERKDLFTGKLSGYCCFKQQYDHVQSIEVHNLPPAVHLLQTQPTFEGGRTQKLYVLLECSKEEGLSKINQCQAYSPKEAVEKFLCYPFDEADFDEGPRHAKMLQAALEFYGLARTITPQSNLDGDEGWLYIMEITPEGQTSFYPPVFEPVKEE